MSTAQSPSGVEGAFDPDALDTEAGRLLFAAECQFIAGALIEEQLPVYVLPEVGFLGRSNVGKSSLINALTGRNSLAKTSQTPGRTRQINFFDLGSRLLLVDMPGYGHAEAPKSEIARWNKLIDDYLKGRPTLMRLCLLIDARHGLKPIDEEHMDMLDKRAVPYQIVLTKGDKLGAEAQAVILKMTADKIRRRPAAHPRIVLSSSDSGLGIANLRAELAALAEPRR